MDSTLDSTVTPLQALESNEIFSLDIPDFETNFDLGEKNTLSYVAGFLVKKLKSVSTCKVCAENLISDIIEPEHTFTTFKEYFDDKKRLTYIRENVYVTLGKIHSIIYFTLPKLGHISHIGKKITLLLKEQLSFDWLICTEHKDLVINKFLDLSVRLIIRKYCDDIYRNNQNKNSNNKLNMLKMRKFRHI